MREVSQVVGVVSVSTLPPASLPSLSLALYLKEKRKKERSPLGVPEMNPGRNKTKHTKKYPSKNGMDFLKNKSDLGEHRPCTRGPESDPHTTYTTVCSHSHINKYSHNQTKMGAGETVLFATWPHGQAMFELVPHHTAGSFGVVVSCSFCL